MSQSLCNKNLSEEHFTFASLRHVYSAKELTSLPSSPAARTLTKAAFLVPRTSHKQVLASPESKFKLQRSMLCATAHLQREASVVQRLHLAQNACEKLCGLKKRSDRSLTDTFPNSSPALAKDYLFHTKLLAGSLGCITSLHGIIPKLHICQFSPKMLAAPNNRSLALACSTMFMQKRLTGNDIPLQILEPYTPATKLTSLASSYAARVLSVVTLLMSRSLHKPILAPPDSRPKIKKSILSAQRHQHFGSAKQTSLRDCTCRKVHAKKL